MKRTGTQSDRSPAALGRADVRRCGTYWVAALDDLNLSWPEIPGARIRPVRPTDGPALRRAMVAASAEGPELAEVRIGGNRLGFLIESASETTPASAILAYGWVARRGDIVDDLGFPLQLPPGESWIYDCATVPAARGKGLYTALLLAMRAALPRYGLAHAWIGTAPQNWPSQRGIARAGFRKVVDVDWNGQLILYGVPGIPASVLHAITAATGTSETVRILPEAGIPWIEAVLMASADASPHDEPEGLRRFRTAYGEQLHWTRRPTGLDTADIAVVLRVGDRERLIVGAAPYEAYERALEDLAPGLPVLSA